MWLNSYDCTHHEKAEEMYEMFKEEVHRHVVVNILPQLKAVGDEQLLKALASSWNTYKDTIHGFSELFQHLTLWIEDVPEDEEPRDGIEKIGFKQFKNEVVLEKEMKKRLKLLLNNPAEEHGDDREESKKIRDMLVDMECSEEFEKRT